MAMTVYFNELNIESLVVYITSTIACVYAVKKCYLFLDS